MKGLAIRTAIAATFTADQWELFDRPGRDAAAMTLNGELEKAVNAAGSTRESALAAMDAAQMRLAVYGAADSEPQRLIERVLDAAFP